MNSSDVPPDGATPAPISRGATRLHTQMQEALAELRPRLERLLNLAQAEGLDQHAEPPTPPPDRVRASTVQTEAPVGGSRVPQPG